MPDAKTIAVYDEKAEEYANRFSNSKPDHALQAFIDLIPHGGEVLDFGCGPATASAHMRDAGLKPDPMDASAGMIALANERHDIDARLGTFDDLDATDKYRGVWANFSLLHAPRDALPRHLAAIQRALLPNGIFHIGMKTGAGAARDGIERLYTYVTIKELIILLTAAGFHIIATETGTEVGLAGSPSPFVIIRARKTKDA